MSENLIYADLNLTEPTRPGLQKVNDVQGSTYAEVKVQSLDTNAAASYTTSGPSCHTDNISFKDSRRGKSCCSRTRVTVLVAVIILLLVLAVCLILMYHQTASSQPDSKTTYEEELGCPQHWKKNRGKCYFFSEEMKKNDWNASRKECTDMNSDLVIIDNSKELNYLLSQSKGHYYLLGLTYSKSENKWKWINNVEHSSAMFKIGGDFTDYFCAVIGYDKVETASCCGSSTTQNMCEKAANIPERQKEI